VPNNNKDPVIHVEEYTNDSFLRDVLEMQELAIVKESARNAGKARAWYTEPLIKMCQNIRKRHPFGTAKEIFYTLPSAATERPIGKIDLDADGLTITEWNSTRLTRKPISEKAFRDFCTRHKILKSM